MKFLKKNLIWLAIVLLFFMFIWDLTSDNIMLKNDLKSATEAKEIQTTLAKANVEIALRYIHSVKDRAMYLQEITEKIDEVFASDKKK
jgi:predicted Holliday junction resolvase-like endonuclease